MSTPPEPPDGTPNLGLLNLLKEPLKDSAAEVRQPGTDSAPADPPQSEQAPVSPLEALAREKNWHQLIMDTEVTLRDDSLEENGTEKVLARTYWLLAQLRASLLPISVLAAPLEALLRSVNSTALFKPHAEARLAEVSKESIGTLRQIGEASVAEDLETDCRNLGADFFQLLQLPASNQNQDAATQAIQAENSPAIPRKPTIAIPEPARPNSSIGFWPLVSGFAIAIVVLGLLLLRSYHMRGSQGHMLPEIRHQELRQPSVAIATPAPIAKVSQLDAIFYGLKDDGKNASATTGRTFNQAPAPAAPTQAERTKEVLNMQGPTEKREVRDIRLRGNRAQQRADLERGGSTALAPKFEEFSSVRVYEVTVPTNVMRAPSIHSEAVAGLKRGDRIKAEGQDGYWLRIRSRGGRKAYVLAQDVTPARDW